MGRWGSKILNSRWSLVLHVFLGGGFPKVEEGEQGLPAGSAWQLETPMVWLYKAQLSLSSILSVRPPKTYMCQMWKELVMQSTLNSRLRTELKLRPSRQRIEIRVPENTNNFAITDLCTLRSGFRSKTRFWRSRKWLMRKQCSDRYARIVLWAFSDQVVL